MSLYLQLVSKLNKLIAWLLGIMVAVMTAVIFWQVFSRFVIGNPLRWSEELARYIMMYIVFMASSIALRHQRLIAVGAVVEKLSARKKRIMGIVINLLVIVFCVLLFVNGLEMVDRASTQTSPAMKIPMSVPYAAIPIGAVLLMINALAVIFDPQPNKGEHHE